MSATLLVELVELVVLTAASAQDVRLVVALAKAGRSLCCSFHQQPLPLRLSMRLTIRTHLGGLLEWRVGVEDGEKRGLEIVVMSGLTKSFADVRRQDQHFSVKL